MYKHVGRTYRQMHVTPKASGTTTVTCQGGNGRRNRERTCRATRERGGGMLVPKGKIREEREKPHPHVLRQVFEKREDVLGS